MNRLVFPFHSPMMATHCTDWILDAVSNLARRTSFGREDSRVSPLRFPMEAKIV